MGVVYGLGVLGLNKGANHLPLLFHSLGLLTVLKYASEISPPVMS
jgi:predicted alpha/beta hydrolase family esterase